MNKPENVFYEINYTNTYGEIMNLVVDETMNIFFYHSDCNEKYEPLDELIIDNNKFKYILSKEENIILENFFNSVDKLIPFLYEVKITKK